MSDCSLCHKRRKASLFKIPKDERKRKKWSDNCGIQLQSNDLICGDHFSPTDIIVRHQKVVLSPNAVPSIQTNDNKRTEDSDLNNFLQENENNKANEKCRCCTTASINVIQLDNYIILNDGIKSTYKDLLYEITNLSVMMNYESKLPQQICLKCEAQLKHSYKFMQQARKICQQYIEFIDHQNIEDDLKNIEQLQETLIEITETPIGEQLKVEPLNVVYNKDIKEEKLEGAIFIPKVLHNEESEEESNFLQHFNTDDQSSDEEESDEPESIKDFDTDFDNESIARRCDICHKVYRNQKFLKIHKRYTHMPEENKRPCPLCSYKASRISAIKVHIGLVHGHDKVQEFFKPVTGDSSKKYPCSLCPRSYGRKDSLRKHVRRKHLNKSPKEETPKKLKTTKSKEKQCFLCTYCGQSYNSKSGLQSHALTHTGERPFSCEVCSKTFKRLKDLQLHRVIHSDEKPYQCSECGKAFKRVDKLKIHMRVHSELRPYKCNECEKTFKYPSVLRTHMHIHTGQTPFSCKTCGEAFSLRTSLNNHCLKKGHVK